MKQPLTRRTVRGYTVTEVMVAASIGMLVMAGVMRAYIWSGRQNHLCAFLSGSRTTAMRTSTRLEMFIRNAEAVSNLDTNRGDWLELRFPDGSRRTLTFREPGGPEGGTLSLSDAEGGESILARGLSRLREPNGGLVPVFAKINDRAVRIAFRAAEPAPGDGAAAAAALHSTGTRFAVCLRNSTE